MVAQRTKWLLVQVPGERSLIMQMLINPKEDGTLWAWVSNDFGQLRDGTLVNQIVPVQIGPN